MSEFSRDTWGLVLGGSSGFGLAAARELGRRGMSIAMVHRDRRGAMSRINAELDAVRRLDVDLVSWNTDALDAASRARILDELAVRMGSAGRIRLLLHSIAYGNLKLIVAEPVTRSSATAELARVLDVEESRLVGAADELLAAGVDAVHGVASRPRYSADAFIDEEDLARTIHSMGTSLLAWTQDCLARGLFAPDARVLGLTSEGNSVAWKGYAAVAAAKVALESIARSIAVEMAPYGIRCNVIQPGITETPALRLIPGSTRLKAAARLRNPFGRLTTPQDVASVVYLLCRDEAAWINGTILRVDGGEHISGAFG